MSTDKILQLNELLLQENLAANFDPVLNTDLGAWLQELLPEIKACQAQPQRTVWHHYPVWGHTLHALDAVNQLSQGQAPAERLLLAYTMLFHDLGKPAVHTTKTHHGQVSDSFPGHALASGEIFTRANQTLKFKPTPAATIQWLIVNHDFFINRAQISPAAVTALVHTIPASQDPRTMLQRLVLVGKADNLAQNLQLAQATIDLIDDFQQKLQAGQIIPDPTITA